MLLNDFEQGLAKIFQATITGLSEAITENQIEFRLYNLSKKIVYIEEYGIPDDTETNVVVFTIDDGQTANIPSGSYRWELLNHQESNTLLIAKGKIRVNKRVQ